MEGRSLLVSDVDGTLLGDDAALARFARWRTTSGKDYLLAYNSGRFPASIAQSVESTRLPAPDVVIGGVGTVMHWYDSGSPLADWTAQFDDWDADGIRRTLASCELLTLQPQPLQSEFKVSYYAYDLTGEALGNVGIQLREAGFQADLVYSSRRDLDVLPRGANKGSATAFLAETLEVPAQSVLVCGDSGNDLAMFQTGFRGIVVGNAHPELRTLRSSRVYQAELAFADGVLEGLAYWATRDARSIPDRDADRDTP